MSQPAHPLIEARRDQMFPVLEGRCRTENRRALLPIAMLKHDHDFSLNRAPDPCRKRLARWPGLLE